MQRVTIFAADSNKIGGMKTKTFKKTYIREWRKKRHLSLRKLAARLEAEPGVELISFVSLSRIETGEQPYSQPVIEAIADALGVTVSMLLEHNREKEGAVVDLVRRMDDATRNEAIAFLEILAKRSA